MMIQRKGILVAVVMALSCASGLPTMDNFDDVVQIPATGILSSNPDEKMKAIRRIKNDENGGYAVVLADCALHDASAVVRREALSKLNEFAVSDKRVQRSLRDVATCAVKDDDGRIRSLACRALRGQPGSETAVVLLETLRREFALERDQRGAKEDLRLRYGKTWWRDSVVRACIDGLVLTNSSGVDVIDKYNRRNLGGDMGYALAHVLYKLGKKPDVEIMIDALGNASSELVKVRIIDDLAEIGDERAISHLKVLLDDRFQIESKDQTVTYPIRMSACRAIEKIGMIK